MAKAGLAPVIDAQTIKAAQRAIKQQRRQPAMRRVSIKSASCFSATKCRTTTGVSQ